MNAVTSLICANIGLWLGFAVYFFIIVQKTAANRKTNQNSFRTNGY